MRTLTSGTLRNIVAMFLLAIPLISLAQADYVFNSPVLVSGTALTTGAVYKYSNVKTGTDAFVTITGFSGTATLANFDATGTGFNEAFQPTLNCPSHKNGYAEFQIDFVVSGPGTNKATATPKVMTEVPVTALDIDGFTFPTGTSTEFNMFKTTTAYYIDYNMIGGELSIGTSSGWVTASNISAIVHTGIDTGSAGRSVMFSMVYANVSSISIRVGIDNVSNSNDSRQASIYFKKFSYPNSFLALPSLPNIPVNNRRSLEAAYNGMKIYPAAVQNNMTVEITAADAATGVLQLIDYSGRIVLSQHVTIQSGTSKIPVSGLDILRSGCYVACLRTGDNVRKQKLVKF